VSQPSAPTLPFALFIGAAVSHEWVLTVFTLRTVSVRRALLATGAQHEYPVSTGFVPPEYPASAPRALVWSAGLAFTVTHTHAHDTHARSGAVFPDGVLLLVGLDSSLAKAAALTPSPKLN
jgi:hypothetical protein